MADCVTRAWLVLDDLTMPLEDEDGGWFMTELNLGYPEVRDVTNNRPDANGIDDRTQFFGARAVSASVTAVTWAGAQIDDVASRFAPVMIPTVRPVLHYVLDRPGAPERVLTLRAAGYAFVVDNPDSRDIQLQWVASDPIVRDPTQHSATAFTGASAGGGRRYNLAFNRVYPAGGGGPASASIFSAGDVPVRPLLRIFGPVTAPVVTFTPGAGVFAMLPTETISGGQFVEVDCAAKTAFLNGDRTLNVLTFVDWPTIYANGGWPLIPPRTTVTMTMTGQSTSGSTQTQAIWQDGYLS
jgi:hypothetical protein